MDTYVKWHISVWVMKLISQYIRHTGQFQRRREDWYVNYTVAVAVMYNLAHAMVFKYSFKGIEA